MQPLSLDAFGEPLHAFPRSPPASATCSPTSRGTSTPASADPHARRDPARTTSRPTRTAASPPTRSALARRIVARSRRWRRFGRDEIKPGAEFESDADLAQAAGDIGTTIFHPVGTAKMGRRDDPMAVVDARLRVHGVAGLRVVDASVMPTITCGNTNSPTLMIAEQAAEMILADAKAR